MSEYNSTCNLIDINPEKKHPMPQVWVHTRKRKDMKGQRKERNGNVCIVLMMMVLMTGFICLSCISAIYITHLQQHVQLLEERVQALEQQSCNSNNQDGEEVLDYADEGPDNTELFNTRTRIKRQAGSSAGDVDVAHESAHHLSAHHGIASHNIALIFGDPDSIRLNLSGDGADTHKFTPSNGSDKDTYNCDKLYVREDEQKWCTTPKHSNIDSRVKGKYQTSRGEHQYYYFKKASWMHTPKSVANYNLTYHGRITVHRAGIYIVHASLHFRIHGMKSMPSYGVYKTDGLGYSYKLLTKCMVNPVPKKKEEGSDVYPCQAWQLAHLNSGDQVFMSIQAYNWFEIEKETFHLALIKLNNFDL